MSNQDLYDFIGFISAEIIINPYNGKILAITGDLITKELIDECISNDIEYILVK